jgi:hypothetical protein
VFQKYHPQHDTYEEAGTILFPERSIMDTGGFLFILMTGLVVIAISYALDHVWAATIPMKTVYYLIRAPGVALHECAHIMGCLITGAHIHNLVLFSRNGGSVTYTRPVIPYLGDVIISTAPLFVIPLILSFITWIFGNWFGCIFPVFPESVNSLNSLLLLGEGIFATISENLISRFNGWFLLYIFLTISLVLSVAPSKQDMKNAAIGFFLLALAGIIIVWSGIPFAESILAELMHLLSTGFTLGLVYGLMALTISIPFIFWYAYNHRT